MQLFFTLLLFSVFTLSPVFAQIQIPLSEKNNGGSYPIDGTHLLDKQEQMVRDYVKQHPDEMTKMKLSKTASWNFTVGSTNAWWSQNFTTGGSYYQVPSTCRKVGINCYIFVEDDLWGNRVNQAAVDSVALYFDSKTPANDRKGIYQSDVETFGNPADVDNDPKIIILIEDIKDGYIAPGGYIAGYFTGLNETSMSFSNKAEIYYLDGDPGLGKNLDGTLSMNRLYQAISTTAHEFQHMIFWNAEKDKKRSRQLTFINEGCSMLAEINAGFEARGQEGQYGYNNETNHYLMDWRDVNNDNTLFDYSRASRFFLYLRDQFGMGIFKKIVNSDQFGSACFNDAFAQMGSPLKLGEVYTNFMMANIADDKSIDQAYGYIYTGLPKPAGTVFTDPNTSSSRQLNNLAGEYLTFSNGNNLKITFNSSGSNLKIMALETGPSGKRILNVPLNTVFNEPEFGSGFKTVTFAVINPSESNPNSTYSFVSTATVTSVAELKWDESEPVGVTTVATVDTICVTFDGVPGGHLDSIRVALDKAGSVTGGVWEFTGTTKTTPLGNNLAFPITASSNSTPTAPYPVPFSNWIGVDLRKYNISTNKPFAVGFIMGNDLSKPKVLYTNHTGSEPYHSYTFISPPQGNSQWYYLTSGNQTVAIYLIRAYLSLQLTDVAAAEGTLKPVNYSLSQNYPNPFNPVTSIRYQIPEGGFVTLKVYDMLGNEVRSLVEKDQQPGEYTATFDGKDLASGIYFYKLTQGRFMETKKLVLMK